MADNVAITAGSGTTVAADEVSDGTLGSCKVQYVKIMDGTLDGTTKAAVGGNGLACDVKASALPSGASTAAKQPALGTAGSASADVLSVQGIASMTALKVDGSAVTQPVSAASLPLPSGAATAAKQPALGTAGTASSDVVTIQGIASMTKLLVTPDANSAVNVAQIAGTTADTNSGTKSAGTIRVVLATDQPQLTNALKVDGSAVTQPVSISGNQAVNIAQINGVTPLMGNGVTGTGSQRVTLASDTSSNTNPFLIRGGGDGTKATYSAAAASITSAASATDIFTIYGSGTKTVKIKRISVTGIQTTNGIVSILYATRSTANSGGTSGAVTAVPHDSTSGAATATVLSYTANPTTGNLVGVVRACRHTITSAAGTGIPIPMYDFGTSFEQPIILRGTSEGFVVNLNGVTVTGGSFSIDVTWTEE